MSEVIKSYKGFDKDLKCRGFQFEIGGEYEEPTAKACHSGFHACEMPIEVLKYYEPGKQSRYCEVEQSGEISRHGDGTKVASTKIKIGAEIGIPGLVKAQIEYVRSRCTNEYNAEPGKPATADDSGAATAGNFGVATAGYSGVATAGYSGVATAGNSGAATAGNFGVATADDSGAATAGYSGVATAGNSGVATAGDSGAATAGNSGVATAGYRGAATAGYSGVATSRGSVSVGENGIGTVRGTDVKIRGGIGAILTCAIEHDDSFGIKEWKSFVVDGDTIKADTWYTVKDGQIVECA